jgi:hypothetical protein
MGIVSKAAKSKCTAYEADKEVFGAAIKHLGWILDEPLLAGEVARYSKFGNQMHYQEMVGYEALERIEPRSRIRYQLILSGDHAWESCVGE